jgi:hypothetical protein
LTVLNRPGIPGGSILSNDGASGNTGAVDTAVVEILNGQLNAQYGPSFRWQPGDIIVVSNGTKDKATYTYLSVGKFIPCACKT